MDVRRTDDLGVLKSILNMETGLRGFAITGDEAFLQPCQPGREAFADAVSRGLASTAPYPGLLVLLENVRGLINNILELGTMDSRVLNHAAEVIDVVKTLRRDAGLNLAYAQTPSAHFEMDPLADRPQVQAAADRLTQILTNLLSDAANFSPNNECVTLSCRIADKFARTEPSDTRQKGGTVLGPSIAKSRVEKCGRPSTAYTNRAAARPSFSNFRFMASLQRQRDWIIPAQPERR